MITQTRTKNSVVTLKIATGEEIIGYFMSENETEFVIRKPVSLVVQDTGVALAPFIMTSDYLKTNESIAFYKTNIVTILNTSKQFSDAYTTQVSGIVPTPTDAVSSKLIM